VLGEVHAGSSLEEALSDCVTILTSPLALLVGGGGRKDDFGLEIKGV